MSELEMKDESEIETEDFNEELSDEALDREQAVGKFTVCGPWFSMTVNCRH